MASFTSRLAGWAAGRLGGQKAKEKTMDWMGKTGVGKVLSFAGDSALMGGAGKLAGMAGRAAGIGSKVGAAATGGTERLPFDTANAPRQDLVPASIVDNSFGGRPIRVPNIDLPESLKPAGLESFGGDVTGRVLSRPGAGFSGAGISQMVRGNVNQALANPSMIDRLQGLGSSLGRGVGNVARGAIDFAKANPQAVGKGLEAFAALQQNQAAQRLAGQRLGLERQQVEANLAQRKQMMEALQPLLAQLRSQMGGMG